MPPYTPNYLKQAKALSDEADRNYYDYVSKCEDSGVERFTPEMIARLNELDEQCIEANANTARLWDKWQNELSQFCKLAEICPNLTIDEFYALGLNENTASESLTAFSEQRNEQVQYSTKELSFQEHNERI